jgi:hypothetical protein
LRSSRGLLDGLRFEHGHSDVDGRRATAALADAVEADALDAAKLADAAGTRVKDSGAAARRCRAAGEVDARDSETPARGMSTHIRF